MLAQSDVPIPFNYTAFDFATNLFVRASIWRFNSVSQGWDFVTAITMGHVANGLYAGLMTGEDGFQYQIQKMVYTDGTFTALDQTRSQGVDEIQCCDVQGLSSGPSIEVALTNTASDLVGRIDSSNFELVGVTDDCCT